MSPLPISPKCIITTMITPYIGDLNTSSKYSKKMRDINLIIISVPLLKTAIKGQAFLIKSYHQIAKQLIAY